MIVRLMPEQIGTFWDLIKTGIIDLRNRFSPGNWNYTNNLFNRCLAGLVQVWLCAEKEEGENNFKGFFLTSIVTDNISEERSLSVISVYAFKQPSKELLNEAKYLIEKYAKVNSCKNITLITPTGHREKLVDSVWPEANRKTLFTIPVG